jgi:SpoVK/Ycf46/Vps4 family AAA+-type ATPase
MRKEAEIDLLIRARYPYLYILSWEERHIEGVLRQVAAQHQKRLFAWTTTEGIKAIDTPRPVPVEPNARAPLQALEHIADSREAAIFVLKDLHPFFGDGHSLGEITLVRRMRDLALELKSSQKTVVLLSPILRFPSELEKSVAILEYALPTLTELEEALDRVLHSVRKRFNLSLSLDTEERERVLKAAQGLTTMEAENVFARSLVLTRHLDLEIIVAEKRRIIRRSRALEYYDSPENMSHVGGMTELKAWLSKRGLAFSEKARQFGLPEPRGVLLLGVQGGGKSLIAKAVASLWKLPLLRLDMGKVFSEMVGSSEENIRVALQMAEAISPSILWIDELEKGLSGLSSSHRSDAGTAARVFGSFLVWLQEKTAAVFVIATSNDISQLPPELLRKGRFDEIFFVDLPTYEERQEIFAIHLAKRQRNPHHFDLERLAQETEGFSGSEIEQVVISALYDAFEAGYDLKEADLLNNIVLSVPLSQTMREQVTALRNWARTHARPASQPHVNRAAWMAAEGERTPVS